VTDYRIRIDALVLRDVPPDLAEGIGPALQERLSARAGGAEPPATAGQVRSTGDLADRIADAVWQHVSTGGGR
jgi:hypothetical protein